MKELTLEEIRERRAELHKRAAYEADQTMRHVERGYCEEQVRIHIGQLFPTYKLCDNRWKGVKNGRHLCGVHLKKK